MAFTAKQLRELEALLEMGAKSVTVKPNNLSGLIRRLKAAEDYIEGHKKVVGDCSCGQYEQWLASKGEAGV